MTSTRATRIAAAGGFLAVVLGAFGAHGLKHLLVENGTTTIWDKAVFYHFIHTVMLFLLAERKPFPALSWWSFLAGIMIFSGSLYLLAVTNVLWLGALTPVGGLALLLGWASLIFKKRA
ncbi:MAG: DUF423 domain-containing protein [Verrucomicrobiota bacterium]|jgi:uncharacterized membrane protein YgdD (TMEM256/DUF423 family)